MLLILSFSTLLHPLPLTASRDIHVERYVIVMIVLSLWQGWRSLWQYLYNYSNNIQKFQHCSQLAHALRSRLPPLIHHFHCIIKLTCLTFDIIQSRKSNNFSNWSLLLPFPALIRCHNFENVYRTAITLQPFIMNPSGTIGMETLLTDISKREQEATF